jgi:hypothetical protein
MKRSKQRLFGAAGFTITASALAMGVGTAGAATTPPSASVDSICVTSCGGAPVPILKLEDVLANGRAQANDLVIVKVIDKVSVVL